MKAAVRALAPLKDAAFQATTPQGPLQLHVPAGMNRVDVVEQALLLARCELLIGHLERWFGLPLDPSPACAESPRPAGPVVFSQSGELGPPGVRVRLPWGLLLQAPPPPPALQACAWPSLLCEVELAQYPFSPGGRDAVRSGQLLLPGAFQADWRVRLADGRLGLQISAGCTVGCAAERAALQQFGGAELWAPPPAAGDSWRVVLAERVVVPLPLALGWQPGSVPWPCTAARLLGPGDPPIWAEGQVVPAWAGAALTTLPVA
jgi:hypothetical protein